MDAAANNWESLVAQVKDQLHAMSPDEFWAGARQLQMLAHSEAGKRGEQHHFDAPPSFVAVGQPIVQAHDGAADRPPYAFVSVSPVKSSRAGVANPTWHPPPGYPCMPPPLPPQQMHPFAGFEAPQPSVSHPAYSHPPMYSIQGQGLPVGYPAGVSLMPSPASYLVRSSQATPMRAHPRGSIYTPTRMSANPQGLEPALPEYTFDSLLLDLGAATPITHRPFAASSPEACQPTATTKMQRTQTASKWSDICFSEPSIQAKEEEEEAETARLKKKRGQDKTIDAVALEVAQPSKRAKAKAKPTRRAKTKAVAAISKISKEVEEKPKGTKARAKINTIRAVADLSTADIICGRGALANTHIGNKRFRDEVKKLRGSSSDWRGATVEDKRLVVQELIERVEGYGGRFVKKGGDGRWRTMEDGDVWKKAVAALRETKW